MVVLAQGELEQIALPAVQKAAPPLADVPEIDLAAAGAGGSAAGRAAAAKAVAAACEEHGFFKVTGHGVASGLLARVEAAAADFFALPQREKEAAMAMAMAPAAAAAGSSPFGYASKRIGSNGDLGWVEYLLLGVTAAGAPLPVPSSASLCAFRELLDEYTVAVRRMTCEVLELMAEALGMEKDEFTRLVLEEDSDSMLRVNHYPPAPRPELKQQLQHGGNGRVTGFGEHTDPQIISVLRSNATSGLEIALRDGTWVSVPPDHTSFFVNVGDALQVLLLRPELDNVDLFHVS
ncbi:hypothetical protein BRADI_2g32577v3 [Brachypodium distachyon]|uniref:Fe2OG dioxygenase domain-containing protein n=1 Tax=Brachypodium distachyon TaxID=15368 RepID=A0A2K2DBH2_BRADI|nr:hypothetical protein BRADI_2g32577v3 [Brachypodium distachyon]